jgi:hypothetical protein
MGIIERIKEIEAEMARTQKNKATGKLNFLTLLVNCNLVSSNWIYICIFCQIVVVVNLLLSLNCNRIPSRSTESKDCKIEDSIAGTSEGNFIFFFPKILPYHM